ncbi:MAG: hypothetical protein JXN61_16085 [Sedimentisphaerales bacterium]|nr:hypothetical protein [Sedimentisphaerales bacterium]
MQAKKWKIRVAVLCLCLGIASTCPGKVIYVDADAAGANDGRSWGDAYNFLQDALADANIAPKPVEIRVAQGIYRPDEDTFHQEGTGDREASFELINGVTLKGGYAGAGELDPDTRDIELYQTILSGQLDEDGTNSLYVLTGEHVDQTAGLDGLTITAGEHGLWNNEAHPTITSCTFAENREIAMYNEYSDPTVTRCVFMKNSGSAVRNCEGCPTFSHCVFSDNDTYLDGGAVYNDDSAALFTDCIFANNYAYADSGDGGLGGGALFNRWCGSILLGCMFLENGSGFAGGAIVDDSCRLIVDTCEFIGNWAPQYGGAIYSVNGGSTIRNCTFRANSASQGGAIHSDDSSPIIHDCTFTANSAYYSGGGVHNCFASHMTLDNSMFSGNKALYGGGIYNRYYSSSSLTNCTFSGNYAPNGVALACHSYYDQYPSDVNITNCIFWEGINAIWNNDGSSIVATFSNVQGGWPGESNIDADPCFADPGYWDPNGTHGDANDDFWIDGDYHLKSQAGRWDASEGGWTMDEVTSPCIDAGDPMSPISYEPFPNGGIINIGAYGGTVEASKSYFNEPPCETIVAGDINGDCQVNFSDLCIMALHWCEDYNS